MSRDTSLGLRRTNQLLADVGEAYETLSDPQKKERYDSGADLQDPEDMFGGGGMGGMGGMGGIDPSKLAFSLVALVADQLMCLCFRRPIQHDGRHGWWWWWLPF